MNMLQGFYCMSLRQGCCPLRKRMRFSCTEGWQLQNLRCSPGFLQDWGTSFGIFCNLIPREGNLDPPRYFLASGKIWFPMGIRQFFVGEFILSLRSLRSLALQVLGIVACSRLGLLIRNDMWVMWVQTNHRPDSEAPLGSKGLPSYHGCGA